IYAYDQFALLPELSLIPGVSYDSVRVPANFREPPSSSGHIERSEWLPKAALVWTPLAAPPLPLDGSERREGFRPTELTIRGIYAWSLSGASFDESFRLEPAQLAGFPQSYRAIIPESVVGSVSGELLKTWGGALDLKLASRTYFGADFEGWESDVGRE